LLPKLVNHTQPITTVHGTASGQTDSIAGVSGNQVGGATTQGSLSTGTAGGDRRTIARENVTAVQRTDVDNSLTDLRTARRSLNNGAVTIAPSAAARAANARASLGLTRTNGALNGGESTTQRDINVIYIAPPPRNMGYPARNGTDIYGNRAMGAAPAQSGSQQYQYQNPTSYTDGRALPPFGNPTQPVAPQQPDVQRYSPPVTYLPMPGPQQQQTTPQQPNRPPQSPAPQQPRPEPQRQEPQRPSAPPPSDPRNNDSGNRGKHP
jgi:hypothetical protein